MGIELMSKPEDLRPSTVLDGGGWPPGSLGRFGPHVSPIRGIEYCTAETLEQKMDFWDFVVQHLAEILPAVIILLGLVKLLSHTSKKTPERHNRQKRWTEAYRSAEQEGQSALDDIRARHGRYFEESES
jgi:hypothetical protein